MVNTNADITLIAIVILLSLTGMTAIFFMVRSHYREMKKLQAAEARENAARLAKIREKNRIKLAEELERVEADRKARAASIPGDRKTDRPIDQMRRRGDVMAEIQRNPAPNLPVGNRQHEARPTDAEWATRQSRYREEHEIRRRDRLRREDDEAAPARRRHQAEIERPGIYNSPPVYPDFTPSEPSKPDTSITPGGGSSSSSSSYSSSSDSSSSSSSSSSDSGSSSSSSD